MTDGKLVRDLIPAIIKASGKQPEIRYLRGDDLINALAAKLCEEANEVAGALPDTKNLIEELADLREVMSALMSLTGITERDVIETAEAKAHARGRFEAGAWLVTGSPAGAEPRA